MKHSTNLSINQMIYGNPLLKGLGAFYTYAEMPEVLANFPLANLQTDSLSELEQEVALIAAESCFVPTEIAVKIAYTMQRMLLKGYIYRNPYLSDNKRFINKLAKNPESMLASLSKRSRKPVSATILKGITNLGKTHIYSRFLDILPAQVIEHDTNEKAGWAYQKQLNWLIVDMSHDGSRSGLLDNLFSAIDCVLKTTYFNDYFGKRISISSKASQAVVALTTHFCGMVVIEELQKRNFEDKCFRQELVLLFLHLLNVGIPVLLVGNPFGFEYVETYLQDIRRLTSDGCFYLEPIDNDKDKENADLLLTGILRCNVLLKKPPSSASFKKAFHEMTATFPGYMQKLNLGSQRIAIKYGDEQLNIKHLEECWDTQFEEEEKIVIRGFVNHNPKLLSHGKDIPYLRYAKRWDKNEETSDDDIATENTESTDNHPNSTNEKRNRYDRARTSNKTKETKEENKKLRVDEMIKSLGDNDLRGDGLKKEFFESLKDI